MRAVVITEQGGPEVLALREVPDPTPGPFDVLVRVEASALNRADLLQRRGLYPAPPGFPQEIPGLELAGRVVACGEHVTRFEEGDRVMGVVGGAACAEQAVLHEREAVRVPDGMSATDAAAVPEAFITAFDAMMLQGGLGPGQWMVVNAAGSGVATAAVQIARAIGARSVGSSRTAAKCERAKELGLDVAVQGTSADLPNVVKEATDGAKAAVAVDLVGGPGLGSMMRCLRPTGALILVGLMGGPKAEISLGHLLAKRLRLRGTVLRSRPMEEKVAVARAFEDRMVPLFEGDAPRLHPVIDRVVPWADVAEAHRVMEDNANTGKIVLEHA
ncbi:MAG: NAD(P)H-quinone oxidoreductase [Myxococcota bacterium]